LTFGSDDFLFLVLSLSEYKLNVLRHIAIFAIWADPIGVKKGDQLSEAMSQPSTRLDKVDPPMRS